MFFTDVSWCSNVILHNVLISWWRKYVLITFQVVLFYITQFSQLILHDVSVKWIGSVIRDNDYDTDVDVATLGGG